MVATHRTPTVPRFVCTGWLHRPLPPVFSSVTESANRLVQACLLPLLCALVGCLAAQGAATPNSVPILATCLQSVLLLPQAQEALKAALQQVPFVCFLDVHKWK